MPIQSRSLLVLVATAALAACGGGSSRPSPAAGEVVAKRQKNKAKKNQPAERVVIPLDEGKPGTEVALTRNFYFIFDGSGSMNDGLDDCGGEKRSEFKAKIDGARWAVSEFLAKVPEDVNLGLYVFDSKGAREVIPLGPTDRQRFERAIGQVRAGGNTPLAKSIRHATDRLVEQYQRQLGYGEYRLIVVTDGRAEKIPNAARYATARGMPIYTIGLCIGTDHALRQYSVSYRAADSFEDLARGLKETLAELSAFDATEFETQ